MKDVFLVFSYTAIEGKSLASIKNRTPGNVSNKEKIHHQIAIPKVTLP